MARDIYPPTRKPDSPFTIQDGWGADLNPADRPAVPKEAPSDVTTVRGRVPERQVPTVKIHQSIEHPDLTPVFGTTCPPRGVSGLLRDFAYTLGEGRLERWMTLMLADRIDVLESRLEDAAHGTLPHPIRERGLSTEFTHADHERKRRNLMLAGAGLGIVALAVTAGSSRSSRRRSRRLLPRDWEAEEKFEHQ